MYLKIYFDSFFSYSLLVYRRGVFFVANKICHIAFIVLIEGIGV